MPIPETQLETWSHQGSISQSSTTYASIKNALQATDAEYSSKEFEVFLQGSYGNDTNIFKESDVDVVIRCNSIFYFDLENLEQFEKTSFNSTYENGNYPYNDFKKQVSNALEKCFGKSVIHGNKAIKIKADGTRRNADIVVTAEFRRYHKFSSVNDQTYDSGICFFNSSNQQIINYPKQHSKNCTNKHQATNGWFKPVVRIIKNIRSKLVEESLISEDTAPSYFLEGLLYNVPNDKFGGTFSDTMVEVINWIHGTDRSKFVCANDQYYLLRDSDVTWSSSKCDLFLNALVKYWNDWK